MAPFIMELSLYIGIISVIFIFVLRAGAGLYFAPAFKLIIQYNY